MTRPLFAFVAPSRGGKSSILKGALAHFPDRLEIVRSITTRTPRGPDHPRHEPDDALYYRYVTREEIETLRAAGRLLQEIEYAGNIYGNDRADVDGILNRVCGITTLVEQGVRNLRAHGYDVRVIRVTPKFVTDERTDARRASDDARANDALTPDFSVLNDFRHPDGLAKAIDQVAMWMRPLIDASEPAPHLRRGSTLSKGRI